MVSHFKQQESVASKKWKRHQVELTHIHLNDIPASLN
ncbi:hypothetical protein Xhom_03216 [Xenorhabdus hominickii]|uniref:Uncharacterized protein n=1 Tax=Xenorhabdus hominickii TaxID=351679 RepID=A0A2G0Q4L6_XENHO|nr:hypothetical protein Xhom_03216 [Xenorhabdus hominickii]